MIFIRDGTRVYQILMLLACVGEFPAEAIPLLGNERTWKQLIRQLGKFQDIAFLEGTHRLRAQVLTVSGKGKRRTIRLHKSVLPYGVYPVYNTREDAMLWRGSGEEKIRILLADIFREGSFRSDIPRAILMNKRMVVPRDKFLEWIEKQVESSQNA